MKTVTATLTLLMFSGVASAQNPDPAKWMCRNLSESGGFLYQGETIFGSQACRPIPQVKPEQATGSPAAPAPAQSQSAPAQQQSPTQESPAQQSAVPSQQPAQNTPPVNRQTPRVFLQAKSHGNTWNARRDQSMEMTKDFEKTCPGIKVTVNQQMADYTVLLNHIELGLFARDNQMEVADKNGDLIQTKEGGGIKGGVKKVCDVILADWAKQQGAQPSGK